jgi:hypothetical protein
MYLIRGGQPDGKAKAAAGIGWGFLGLVIIVSIWGIVNFLVGTFKTTPTVQPIPNIGNNVQNGGIPSNY